MIPSTPPIFTSVPSLTLISDNTPALGAGTSMVILSVKNNQFSTFPGVFKTFFFLNSKILWFSATF